MALTVESYAEYIFRLKPHDDPSAVPEWTPPVRAPRPKHHGKRGGYLMCPCAHCVAITKAENRRARLRWVYGDAKAKRVNPYKAPLPIVPVGVGPSSPIWAHKNPVTKMTGKADPIWDTEFTTKFSRKPAEDAPLVTPKGAQPPMEKFLSRVEEIAFLAATQHQELATTLQEMNANGIRGFSLDRVPEEDERSANIAQSHLRMVPVDPDPGYIATMQRRIEWERYIFACGPVHRTRFAITPDGKLGIVYEGPEKDPEKVLAHKRSLKNKTLDRYGRLPTVEEVEDAYAFWDYYKKPINFMTDEERQAYIDSRHGWETNEDPDPGRHEFHAVDLRGKDDRGYAGPHGALGIDDESDDEFLSDPE